MGIYIPSQHTNSKCFLSQNTGKSSKDVQFFVSKDRYINENDNSYSVLTTYRIFISTIVNWGQRVGLRGSVAFCLLCLFSLRKNRTAYLIVVLGFSTICRLFYAVNVMR